MADRREISDESLLAAYCSGDLAAFGELVRRYERPLFSFIARQISDVVMAEDLLQEVFVRVVKRAATFRHESKFSTWAYTIARNLCIDAARRGKHRKTLSLDQQGEDAPAMQSICGNGIGVEREVTSRALQLRLEQAVASLSAEQREVFLMRENAGLAFKEIAAVVGCPENTVKSRMRYALEHLRRVLDDCRELLSVAG